MDCQDLPSHTYLPPGRRRSCTTQSDPVNRLPDNAGEDTTMMMPPQQLSQSCDSPMETDSPCLAPPYPTRQDQHSYTSSQPVGYFGSSIASQVIAGSPTWPASQTSSWIGELPSYSLSDQRASRDLPLASFDSIGTAETWSSPQQHQATGWRGPDYHLDPYRNGTAEDSIFGLNPPLLAAEQVPHYSHLNMSPTPSNSPNFPFNGYAGSNGSMSQCGIPYRRLHLESLSSTPADGQLLVHVPGQSLSSSPQARQKDEETSDNLRTPGSDMSDGPSTGCYPENELKSASSSVKMEARESSIPATPSKGGDTPYAQLIYQALMTSPRHAMTLQEIYQWFRENTDKGQPGQGKGWQNSIRHNLSMNAAFERQPINGDSLGGGEDCASPSGSGKKSTEWVLLDNYARKGVESTTRYRNSARRNQNKKMYRAKSKSVPCSRRTTRRRATTGPSNRPYNLPSVAFFDPRHQFSRSYIGSLPPNLDLPSEQLQRLSLAQASGVDTGRDHDELQSLGVLASRGYDHAEYRHSSSTARAMEMNFQNSYQSVLPGYSSELFQPSIPGAPTVASEDDVNEVITPEASFSILEPNVLVHGNHHPGHAGPTSNPYNPGGSTYCSGISEADADGLPRYGLGDVAGVCEGNMLQPFAWNDDGHSQH